MAAAVAVAALGGGTLWLHTASRTAAVPERPTPEPTASPLPATRARAPIPPVRRPVASGQEPARSSGPGVPAGNRAEPDTVDLAGWKLTLPTAGDNGGAASVNPLVSGGPWLNRAGDGALRFWAPSEGATTPNSQHARTELVSQNNFTAGSGPHTLRVTVAVTQAPSMTQDIILGQIHGAGDIKSVPFVMLHYKAGAINVVVKRAQSGADATTYPLLSGVPLGVRFSFSIAATGNGTLVFSATRGSDSRRVSAPIPDAFQGATVRFQAGDYQLGKSGDGSDAGGRVTFYSLTEKPVTP